MKTTLTLSVAILLGGFMQACGTNDSILSQEEFGRALFSDATLSANETMSCETCHSLNEGLVDQRETNKKFGASLGDDNISIGDRNAPTASYAQFAPDFHYDIVEKLYIGGQFLNGSAKNLTEQAKGPFLNPVEMGMPDAASVVTKVLENSTYVATLTKLYGAETLEDVNATYEAIAESIAAFESTKTFAPFDSKYDRFLAGTYTLSAAEQNGMDIYTNEDAAVGAGRCTLCHPITKDGDNSPLMTDYSYDNLGVPINTGLRAVNGVTSNDEGLYSNPQVSDVNLKGAFKVSSLRNVAVTGPYMHNGVFKDLKTVVHFYSTRDVGGAINPETNTTWKEGEFHSAKNTDELGNLGLTDEDEENLVAFLKTFTDAKYESLIK